LHVTPYAADAWAYGGIPRVSASMARGLAARGHHVTIATTDACEAGRRLPGASSEDAVPYSAGATALSGPVVRVFPNVSNRLAYNYQCFLPIGLAGFLRQHAASFDVAHLHACRNFPGALAAHHLHLAGVPYVLAPNGTAPNIERHKTAKRVFDLLAGQRILRRAARLVAVTQAERGQLIGLGVPQDRIAVVPNPVELDEFQDRPVRGRYRQILPPGPLVVYLGKLTPRKRVDLLIRAFAALGRRDATLVIAGNDMGTEAAARATAAEVGVADRTMFAGLLRGRERLELLADADVVVYPSEHEIFGLVPLEALLAGSPVVVTDDSGCGEVIGATGGGLVVRGDVESLRSAIDHVLRAPEHWRAAAAEAAVRVRSLYAPDVVCAQIETLYQEMAAAC